MVALIDGAYQSILGGGDVSVRFAKEETKVLSTLEPNEILTWQYYEKLRAEKIPYGGSVPPEEQRIRDLIYLTCGSTGMVI